MIISGTCGWSYQEWVGAFYPNNRVAKLPFYSRVFSSVEVDSSFYRAPSKSMIAGWLKSTGLDFKFSLKIPKAVTHDRRLVDAEEDFFDFVDLIRPVQDAGKLGCLLIQLPPDFTYGEKSSLESFLDLLPDGMDFATEFRHESWNREESWGLLEKYDVAHVVADSPIAFLAKPRATTATHSYVRWHGHGSPVWYNYTYSEEELRSWLGRLQELEARVPVVYAYFNNHYRAGAPDNLLHLLEMRGELTQEQKKVKERSERRKHKVAKLTEYISEN